MAKRGLFSGLKLGSRKSWRIKAKVGKVRRKARGVISELAIKQPKYTKAQLKERKKTKKVTRRLWRKLI